MAGAGELGIEAGLDCVEPGIATGEEASAEVPDEGGVPFTEGGGDGGGLEVEEEEERGEGSGDTEGPVPGKGGSVLRCRGWSRWFSAKEDEGGGGEEGEFDGEDGEGGGGASPNEGEGRD